MEPNSSRAMSGNVVKVFSTINAYKLYLQLNAENRGEREGELKIYFNKINN